jgi:hypothetical protein
VVNQNIRDSRMSSRLFRSSHTVALRHAGTSLFSIP